MNPYDNNYNNNPYNNGQQPQQGQPNPYLSYKHFSEDSNYADPTPPKPPVEILTDDNEKKSISNLASSLVGGMPNVDNSQQQYNNIDYNQQYQQQMYQNQNMYNQYPNNMNYQNQQYNPYQQYYNNGMYPNNNNNQNNQN